MKGLWFWQETEQPSLMWLAAAIAWGWKRDTGRISDMVKR